PVFFFSRVGSYLGQHPVVGVAVVRVAAHRGSRHLIRESQWVRQLGPEIVWAEIVTPRVRAGPAPVRIIGHEAVCEYIDWRAPKNSVHARKQINDSVHL